MTFASMYLAVLFVLMLAGFTRAADLPSYPLAVRSPHLQTWLPRSQADNVPVAQPEFAFGQPINCAVLARVNGVAYTLFGIPSTGALNTKLASQTGRDWTATHTTFTLSAGTVTFTLDFWSPVDPTNYIRQSLPYSYLTVTAQPATGSTPSIEIYSDIDSSWTGQNSTTTINYSTSGNVGIFAQSVPNIPNFETGNCLTSQGQHMAVGPGGGNCMALWGSAVLASVPSSSSDSMTAAVGTKANTRQVFISKGSLGGVTINQTEATGQQVAFAHSIGTISISKNVTFAVGHNRNAAIQYYAGEIRTAYHRAVYPTIAASVAHFLADMPSALAQTRIFDQELQSKAAAVSVNYSTIVTATPRQIFGALEVTIPSATLDTNDIMAFVKEMSSDGNVNTLGMLFSMHPALVVLAPEYIRHIIEPVLRYTLIGKWDRNYAIPDIGSNYPNATGHDDQTAEYLPLDDSSDLLMLTSIYSTISKNFTYVNQYKTFLNTYATNLTLSGLYTSKQKTNDDAGSALANQTNLAIKDAIALNAYGNITNQSHYSLIGQSFGNQLYNGKVGTDPAQTHFTLEFGMSNTWVTAYNIFPDVLLRLSTLPEAAYTMQSKYYHSIRRNYEYGLPLAAGAPDFDFLKTDWAIYAAATDLTNVVTRNQFINDVYALLVEPSNQNPLSDKYTGVTGPNAPPPVAAFRAKPNVGGHFAILALQGLL